MIFENAQFPQKCHCRSVASEASEGTTPNNETIQPTFFTTFLGAEFAQNLDARRQFCVF